MANEKIKAVLKNQKYNKFLISKIIQEAVIADLRYRILSINCQYLFIK